MYYSDSDSSRFIEPKKGNSIPKITFFLFFKKIDFGFKKIVLNHKFKLRLIAQLPEGMKD